LIEEIFGEDMGTLSLPRELELVNITIPLKLASTDTEGEDEELSSPEVGT
jgi:hypothetical protein